MFNTLPPEFYPSLVVLLFRFRHPSKTHLMIDGRRAGMAGCHTTGGEILGLKLGSGGVDVQNRPVSPLWCVFSRYPKNGVGYFE